MIRFERSRSIRVFRSATAPVETNVDAVFRHQAIRLCLIALNMPESCAIILSEPEPT
jgi:hypothetical protein